MLLLCALLGHKVILVNMEIQTSGKSSYTVSLALCYHIIFIKTLFFVLYVILDDRYQLINISFSFSNVFLHICAFFNVRKSIRILNCYFL